MSNRQRAVVLIGILISAVFLWFAFRGLHPEAVLDELRQADLGWITAGAAWFFVSLVLMALRWQYLIRAIKLVPLSRLISLVSIGYTGNNVYPFRSGEALRIYLLHRGDGVPFVKGTTTVIVERIFDGLVMLTFIVVCLPLTDIVSRDIQRLITVAAPVFVGGLAVFFVLAARPDWLRALVKRVGQILPGKLGIFVTSMGEDVIDGLEGLRTPAHLAGTVISSYASWILHAGVYWMVAMAFDIQVSFWVLLVVVGAVNLAGLIPASPGQVGVFEFFASLVLVAAGVPEAQAASYAVTVHVVIWLPVTLLGFVLLARQGLTWNTITRAHQLSETAAQETPLDSSAHRETL